MPQTQHGPCGKGTRSKAADHYRGDGDALTSVAGKEERRAPQEECHGGRTHREDDPSGFLPQEKPRKKTDGEGKC